MTIYLRAAEVHHAISPVGSSTGVCRGMLDRRCYMCHEVTSTWQAALFLLLVAVISPRAVAVSWDTDTGNCKWCHAIRRDGWVGLHEAEWRAACGSSKEQQRPRLWVGSLGSHIWVK